MATLIVGASGATGRLLVQELLNCGESVRVIVRANSNLSEPFTNTPLRNKIGRLDESNRHLRS